MLSRRSVTSDPLGVTVLSPPPTPSFDFSSSVNATGSAGARIGSFWLRALQTSLPNGCAFFSDFNLAVFNRRSVCSFSACFTALLCPCTSFAWCRNCLCKRRSFSAVCSALTRFCLFRWARVSFSFRLMIFVAFAELPSLSSSSSSLNSSSKSFSTMISLVRALIPSPMGLFLCSSASFLRISMERASPTASWWCSPSGRYDWPGWATSTARLGGASASALLRALICFLDSLAAGWVGGSRSGSNDVAAAVDDFLSFSSPPADGGGDSSHKSKVGLAEDARFLTLFPSNRFLPLSARAIAPSFPCFSRTLLI
mmetsp:Transcript_15053/g.32862  ORF Transcript_15053/g.32862 Transcript_15053/m.32862 type:complete len:312 (-) Transcript_15053:374-1309(-)